MGSTVNRAEPELGEVGTSCQVGEGVVGGAGRQRYDHEGQEYQKSFLHANIY